MCLGRESLIMKTVIIILGPFSGCSAVWLVDQQKPDTS